MKVQFQHNGANAEFDTVKREIYFKSMTIPLMNAGESLRNAVIQAKIDVQRRGTEQFNAAQFLGN